MIILSLGFSFEMCHIVAIHPPGSQSSMLALEEVEVAALVWDVLEVAAVVAIVRPVALDLGT